MNHPERVWPSTDDEASLLQLALAERADSALRAEPWELVPGVLMGGCFVAFERRETGPGHAGDQAWAAAVVWRSTPSRAIGAGGPHRDVDHYLRGVRGRGPRRASDVAAQAVVGARVPAGYRPGLLARREGPILAAAVAALDLDPDVLLVNATGLDHPRRAGLALHLGYAMGIPAVGVTRRPLVASGDRPFPVRGAMSPVRLAGRTVGYWVCTRTRAHPVLAHAAWRTDPDTAATVVLAASTEGARTPVPLQEARRVAREARTLGSAPR